MPDQLDTDDLASLATNPQRTTTVEGTVEEHDLYQHLAVDRHLRNAAAEAAPYGARISKIRPGGAA
jgi:hypothetical protein